MATKVVKGAGRARHEANKRHQQRTPLPPRPGQVAAAKEAIAATTPKTTGSPKADALVAVATGAGWELTGASIEGNKVTVVFSRGAESITGSWTNGVWDYPGRYDNGAGGTKVLLNASAAKKMMAMAASEVKVSTTKPKRERKAREEAPTEEETTTTRIVRLPFDPHSAADNDILNAIRGHKIKWLNKFSGIQESGVVPINGTKTVLHDDDLDAPGTRQLTFCDASGEGYRTVRIGALTWVSSGIHEDAAELDIHQRAQAAVRAAKGKKTDEED